MIFVTKWRLERETDYLRSMINDQSKAIWEMSEQLARLRSHLGVLEQKCPEKTILVAIAKEAQDGR